MVKEMWSKHDVIFSVGRAVMISSTYLFQNIGSQMWFCSYKIPPANLYIDHLNLINHNIHFTNEEVNKTLLYLDLLISWRSDGHLRFFVYRKPTHTNRYLDSESYHPLSSKIARASNLFHRATNNCGIEHKQEKIYTSKTSLKINGYTDNLINNCYQNNVTKNNNHFKIQTITDIFRSRTSEKHPSE